MKITLLTVGKTDRGYLKEGIDMYCGRIGHYAAFRMIEIPDVKGASSLSRAQIKEKEADNVFKYIHTRVYRKSEENSFFCTSDTIASPTATLISSVNFISSVIDNNFLIVDKGK